MQIVVRPDGVAHVSIDPCASVSSIGREIAAAAARIDADAGIECAVLASAPIDPLASTAHLDRLRALRFAADAERLARDTAQALLQLSRLSKPIVAALQGPTLGLAFEIALACRAIVAADDRETVVALPDVQRGLLPMANGALRVAARGGLRVALDLALTGRAVSSGEAARLGLVDETCPGAIVVDVATRAAEALSRGARPSRRPRLSLGQLATEANPLGRALLFKRAREAALAKTRGHYPATARILDVLERLGARGFAAAADLEARTFGELVVSETAHRLMEVFRETAALARDRGVDDVTVAPRLARHVGVVGGGLVGSGVALLTLDAGASVRIAEKDDAGVARALRSVSDLIAERVALGRLSARDHDRMMASLTAGSGYSGLRNADVVIEAVFEDLALKQAVLREVEAAADEDCVFASNTASIPLTRIALAARHPERVLGMHYFNPVHKMPLLEIVRTEKTSARAVATCVALGQRQGKTVIVVRDGVGFYTSRVLAPYLAEAIHLLGESVGVEAIDGALVDWGWPVGPLQLFDELGIDVVSHVAESLHDAFGDRMAPPPGLARVLQDDRKGKKNGRGFYLYGKPRRGARRPVDPSLYAALGAQPRSRLPLEEIQMRCALRLVNEALLCLGEAVVRSPRDADLGAILGLGFPAFRGGPLRYVDTIGAAETLRRVQGYADRFGKRWAPAPLLAEMARRGDRFYAD